MAPLRTDLEFGSLRGKFLWGTVLVIVLVMATVITVVEHRLRVAIIDEVERRGEVLVRNLAAMSYGPLLLYNFTALEQNVARVGGEADVVYAIVLDAEGKVAAHSRHPERVGFFLEGAVHDRAARTGTLPSQEAVAGNTGESVYDFAVPVLVSGEKWGTVRVGLSKRRMEAEIRRTRWELGALTGVVLLLGGLAAALVARRIARPVQRLAEGVAAISRGELNQRIEPSTSDEIGRLAVAFNHMATQLLQQRTALEEAHAELRRHFEELADLKSYTDNILGSLTTGIVTIDLDGRVVTLNPAAELLTGFFKGEASGRYCTEVFAHTAQVGEVLMETLASRVPAGPLPLTLRRRNGTSVPVELSTAPLKGGEGKDLGVIGLFRDLSAVRDLENQLRRSDRLAALGTLAAGMAHEIKNPLTSLLTFSRHLERKFDDEHFRQKFQSVVPRELERINRIVERLLELSRPMQLTFTAVRLPALLERVVELYANHIEAKRIEVVREYARDLPTLQADPEYLYRALVNLVANALDAMEDGGRLTLRAGWSAVAPGLLAPRRGGANRRLKVEIEDTGVGIPASDADRVFNPFFTTKEHGTGLGLALTYKIVEDHGGTIDFRSVPGVGTTFRILLPPRPETRPEAT
ncbi:MAG: HAMP domain-containing protein [Candidatus Rokubacteria bacterium]|nr:HAMP domain-containing protein [Candidatus Rokubacteria bacterium]